MADGEVAHICVHGIGPPRRELEPGESRYWVSETRFLDILDWVAGRPQMRLSFDDGNASDVQIGLPALLQRGLTATFFIVAGRLGQPGSLDHDDVRTLVASGMSVGSHGLTHEPWPKLDPMRLDRELVDARDVLEGVVGQPVDRVALPLGRYDRRVLRRLRQLGYAQVCTSDRRLVGHEAWLEHRFSLDHDDTPQTLTASISRAGRPRHRVRATAVGMIKRMR